MVESEILEKLRAKLSEIDGRLSNIYLNREGINGEAGKFERLRKKTIAEIDKKTEEEINKYKCKIKCPCYKNPIRCMKKDKRKCPYTKQFKMGPFIKKKKA